MQQRILDGGVLVERCGPNGDVIKLMPPVNAPTNELDEGFGILANALTV